MKKKYKLKQGKLSKAIFITARIKRILGEKKNNWQNVPKKELSKAKLELKFNY